MAELAATRERGWSYSAGYSQEYKAFHARAWKPRPKPHRTPHGVLLLLHTVSAIGETIDDAARVCAQAASQRDDGDARLSSAEISYAEHVASWQP